LGSQGYRNNEVMEGVKTWLRQAADFIDAGIQKPILQYKKCLIFYGYCIDCIEKWLK
jgi:hypothetical protein